MVKKTKFDHHPVEITKGFLGPGEEWGSIAVLEKISALLDSGSLSDGWGTLNISALAIAQSIDVPDGAIAVILGVEVQDSGASGAEAYIAFGYGGLIDLTNFPGRAEVVYCQGLDDRWIGKTVILPLTEANLVDYLAEATGSTTLDYRLKLIGWLIGGTDYTMPEHPYQNLHCAFAVDQ
jgi:hypothetical protein